MRVVVGYTGQDEAMFKVAVAPVSVGVDVPASTVIQDPETVEASEKEAYCRVNPEM